MGKRSEVMGRLPGNTRNGFITFDSRIHFYSLQEGLSQAQMLIVSDIKALSRPFMGGMMVFSRMIVDSQVMETAKMPQH
uniref:Protein transport protein Sec24A-like n=1 Tax=Castor canadensis TaxID=51338 RepID=A0A8B7TJ63_CASCN|nr:protein transport protein Sec24A-like [Castor canadensis]